MIHCRSTRTGVRPNQPAGRWSSKLFLALAASACWLSAQAGQVSHGISAANVTVTQNSTDPSSTSAVSLTNALSINDLRVGTSSKRGLYYVQVGASAADDATNGILISCIAENGRDNNEGSSSAFPGTTYGSSAVAASTGSASTRPAATGQWTIPVFGNAEPTSATNVVPSTNSQGIISYATNYVRYTTNYAYTTYNFNVAAAYFPFAKGWLGGWLVNTYNTNNAVVVNTAYDTLVGNTNLVLGTHVIPASKGVTTVDLRAFGLDASSNAVLICAGGKNEENFAVSRTNADGTWTITCRDDQSGSAEADPIAFVAIPLTNTAVVAGRFGANLNAANAQCSFGLHNGSFNAVHIASGTYKLTIPGVTPGHGVLIISGDEDGPNNGDNLVSYQATNDGWIVQTRDTGDSQTPNLQNFSYGDTIINFVYIPAATAGVTVTPTNGLATSQGGAPATFAVTLDAVPAGEVDLPMVISDATAAAFTNAAYTNTLVFQSTNWNVPQTVTVTGLANGQTTAEAYTVAFQPAVSTDTNYNGFQAPSVGLVNIPTAQPGIFLVPASGLVTTGAGGTATFEAIMNIAPASDVTVNFSSSDTTQGTVSPAAVTFNSSNWSTPQIVTVTGMDDKVVDGNIAYQINAAAAVSSDANYSGYQAGSVSVVNLENDVAGVTVSCGSAISVLEGYATTFTVALSAAPVSNVTVAYASSDPAAGSVSPAALVFTPANWNVPQTVTLTGIANGADTGNTSYYLEASLITANYGYSTLAVPEITATTTKPVGLSSGTTVYGLGMAPVGIDGQATASDAINFSGAILSFSIITNADATDVLGIRNDPTGTGITVTGNAVSYSGVQIATSTGGTAGAPLVVTLGSNVTGDTVAALIQAVTFSSSTTTNFASRTVQLSLNSGASVASKSIRVGQLRVTAYQNGLDWGYGSYNSETNVEIAQTNAVGYVNGSSSAGLLVQVDANLANQHQVLMGFYDLVGSNAGQIPPGAIIVAADLSVNIVKAGYGWSFNRMLVPWDATASWSSFEPYYYGVYMDVPENNPNALLEYDSQLGNYVTSTNALGSVSDTATAISAGYVSIGVTPDVQAWVNGATNCGWVLNAGSPWGSGDLTTGTGFTSGQDANTAIHPRLRVYWLPAGTASASFQSGVNSYTNAFDTEITQASPNNNNASLPTFWSDGADLGQADATETLLRFDHIIGATTNQVPPGAHVEVAMLNLSSLNNKDCVGNGGQFYALLQPWQDTNVTWNSWNPNGSGIVNDGVRAAASPTVTAGVYTESATAKVPGGYHSFEVTSDVQNWANGAQLNYGWGIVPWQNGSDGWGINSSKDGATNAHPQLVVYYTPASATVAWTPKLLTLTADGTQVQVPFTGTVNTPYTIWRSDSLTGTWTSVGTATVSEDGTGTFTDTAPLAASAFYRVTYP